MSLNGLNENAANFLPLDQLQDVKLRLIQLRVPARILENELTFRWPRMNNEFSLLDNICINFKVRSSAHAIGYSLLRVRTVYQANENQGQC